MDKASLAGLVLALLAIGGGQVLEGGHLMSLVQPTAFVIVVGGTLGAVMLQSPMHVFIEGLRISTWVFAPPRHDHQQMIRQVTRWSTMSRKEGLLALENEINRLSDPFVGRGLQLLVDGAEPGKLREALAVETEAYEANLKAAAKIWESAGGYAPTIGILGAVMGLIHVMENLSDPSKLGAGIAVAFVATIYGVGAANLVFLPMAKKLMACIAELVKIRDMYIDGLVGIANGDNPRIIEGRLQGYAG